jgi:hypothetical protein
MLQEADKSLPSVATENPPTTEQPWLRPLVEQILREAGSNSTQTPFCDFAALVRPPRLMLKVASPLPSRKKRRATAKTQRGAAKKPRSQADKNRSILVLPAAETVRAEEIRLRLSDDCLTKNWWASSWPFTPSALNPSGTSRAKKIRPAVSDNCPTKKDRIMPPPHTLDFEFLLSDKCPTNPRQFSILSDRVGIDPARNVLFRNQGKCSDDKESAVPGRSLKKIEK